MKAIGCRRAIGEQLDARTSTLGLVWNTSPRLFIVHPPSRHAPATASGPRSLPAALIPSSSR
jgi:hypothetical protein